MEAQSQVENKFKRLKDLIAHIRVAMLTTLDEKGNLVSRPMSAQKVDEDGVVWFFTKKSSSQSIEVGKDQRVNLAFSNPDKQLYVSVSGAAREEDDKAKIDELWGPAVKSWFPGGKDDANLTLLRVEMHLGEYWDISSSKMMQLYNIAGTMSNEENYIPNENETISIDEVHNNPGLLTVPYKIDAFL